MAVITSTTTNRMKACADEYPILKKTKPFSYMLMTIVLPAAFSVPGGSAPRMMKAVSKTWKQAMSWVMTTKKIEGVNMGSVIWKNCDREDAPSIWAAS